MFCFLSVDSPSSASHVSKSPNFRIYLFTQLYHISIKYNTAYMRTTSNTRHAFSRITLPMRTTSNTRHAFSRITLPMRTTSNTRHAFSRITLPICARHQTLDMRSVELHCLYTHDIKHSTCVQYNCTAYAHDIKHSTCVK
mgnify:CR=1 FL=1